MGLSVEIKKIRIVIAGCDTCLIRGRYSFGIKGRLIFFDGIWSMEGTDWKVRRLVSEGY